MKILVEVLIDETQLSDEEIDKLKESVQNKAEFACDELFWYRDARTFDYEVVTKTE